MMISYAAIVMAVATLDAFCARLDAFERGIPLPNSVTDAQALDRAAARVFLSVAPGASGVSFVVLSGDGISVDFSARARTPDEAARIMLEKLRECIESIDIELDDLGCFGGPPAPGMGPDSHAN